MIYGYCRISTKQQSIERQIRNITNSYAAAVIVQEIFTGTQTNRPEWNKLYKQIKSGDTIVFDSVSRMSRNADEGFELYESLYNKGAELVFLKEPHINTSTYKKAMENNISMTGTTVDYILDGINKYLMSLAKEQIKIAFQQAEKEVTDLRQRTVEGIETARLNGRQIGQAKGKLLDVKKEAPAKAIIREKSKDFNGSNSDSEVMAILKNKTFTYITDRGETITKPLAISRNTYYKYKTELKESC